MARREKMRQTRDEADHEVDHVIVRAANIQMIRNMPDTDAALTKGPERKGGIVVEDDRRAPFTLQGPDYVKVEAGFCPGSWESLQLLLYSKLVLKAKVRRPQDWLLLCPNKQGCKEASKAGSMTGQ
ncbi:unnamed protein product [Cylindrotheca closterium]|uniref:Uncharacterized protein n=1 Tax=Cylindrotheca closterium TaxID=2856 RepID=A0AAD2PUK8_9STRA|nr:unnamed protein product [Cylindrotheca closterium]